MNQLQNKSFEEALVRYREKWDKIKDPCVVYDFPIPDVSCKELFLKRVSEHPDKTYVISHGAKMSYVECNTLAAKIANGFLANGLKKGDRVITYVSNGFEFVALAHACFKTGIIKENDKVIGLKVSIKTAEQIRKYSAGAQRNNAVYNFQDIIAVSSGMKLVKSEARTAAASPANVLITGESGTGKELFAQAIHNASPRFAGPFVPISCGGFSRETVDSILIGTEKNPGKFIQADGGTLFLDGISEMSQDMQSFLLRFLEDGIVTPIGSRRSVQTDVRVISAAGSEVLQKVKDGSFRLDLYYRLNVLRIDLPPLRERQADMQELSNYFVTLLSAGYGKNIFSVSAETVERFKANYWPGNLRQLRNIIERSLLKAEDGRELEISDVCDDFGGEQTAVTSQKQGRTLDMRDAETNRILDALLKHNGNKAKTARYLGMSRGTLYNRLRELEANGIVL